MLIFQIFTKCCGKKDAEKCYESIPESPVVGYEFAVRARTVSRYLLKRKNLINLNSDTICKDRIMHKITQSASAEVSIIGADKIELKENHDKTMKTHESSS